MTEIDASQLDLLMSSINVQAATVATEAHKLVEDTLPMIEATAVDIVPRKTGATARSASHEMTSPLEGEVGFGTWYAPFIEHGTVRQAPKRPLGTALDMHQAWFDDQLAAISTGLLR